MMKRIFRILALVTFLIMMDVSTAQGDSLPESAYISGVKGHAQSYTLSCESRSAVDLAAFWGIHISETEFLQALPRSDNPEKGFVGNPNEAWGNVPPHGYGVNASPVADTLQAFGMEAIGLSDLSWDDLRSQISGGSPVIVWVIGEMWDGTPVSYETSDGSSTIVAAFEHTMLLTGYSQDTVQVIDAYSGQYHTYPLNTFLKSWAVLGNMALFGSRHETGEDAPPPEAISDSYTVQPGDYVIALAKRFGISWIELADLNSIGYPYTIQPGQVLRLPAKAAQESETAAAPVPASEAIPASDPAAPAPDARVVNFKVRLPLVQREYTFRNASSIVASPALCLPAQPVTTVKSNLLASFGESLGVDWHLLDRLKELILPSLVHAGELLWLK